MRILAWHVHGSWMTSFVSGDHQYLIPTLPDRSEDGRGRARTFDWPPTVVEISPDQLEVAAVDLVLLQRPAELELFQKWVRLFWRDARVRRLTATRPSD